MVWNADEKGAALNENQCIRALVDHDQKTIHQVGSSNHKWWQLLNVFQPQEEHCSQWSYLKASSWCHTGLNLVLILLVLCTVYPRDCVWPETTHLSTDCPSPKFDWKQIGPLSIAEWLGPLTYCLHLQWCTTQQAIPPSEQQASGLASHALNATHRCNYIHIRI